MNWESISKSPQNQTNILAISHNSFGEIDQVLIGTYLETYSEDRMKLRKEIRISDEVKKISWSKPWSNISAWMYYSDAKEDFFPKESRHKWRD